MTSPDGTISAAAQDEAPPGLSPASVKSNPWAVEALHGAYLGLLYEGGANLVCVRANIYVIEGVSLLMVHGCQAASAPPPGVMFCSFLKTTIQYLYRVQE